VEARRRTFGLVLFAGATLLIGSGSGSAATRAGSLAEAASPSVGVVGPVRKVRPTETGFALRSARLVAARNEVASFQIVVGAGGTRLRGADVTLAEPLHTGSTTIAPANVTIYREAYYRVRTPSDVEGATGRWPDPLIPKVDRLFGQRRNAFPVDIPARENRVAWIDLQVPDSAPVGRYSGAFLVSGDGLRRRVPVELTVLDFRLPSTSSLTSAFGLSANRVCEATYGDDCYTHYRDGWWLKSLYVRAALDNRISIFYPQFEPPISSWETAFFDRYVRPYLDGVGPTRLRGAKLTSIQADRRFLPSWRTFAGQEDIAARAFAFVCDEPKDPAAWERCRTAASDARSAWPTLSTLVTAPLGRAAEADAFRFIDILAADVYHLRGPPGRRSLRDAFLSGGDSRRFWIYTDCDSSGCGDPSRFKGRAYVGWPGYAVDQPASSSRAMGWLAFEYGASGELYWGTDWKITTAWTDQSAFGTQGEGTLFYPGRPDVIGGSDPIPIESMRMKLIRDGYQDYEYLEFLADHGRRAEAERIAAALFPRMNDTVRTDAQVQVARRKLARAVARVADGPRP
jgi:hypothetical protein